MLVITFCLYTNYLNYSFCSGNKGPTPPKTNIKRTKIQAPSSITLTPGQENIKNIASHANVRIPGTLLNILLYFEYFILLFTAYSSYCYTWDNKKNLTLFYRPKCPWQFNHPDGFQASSNDCCVSKVSTNYPTW